MKYSEWSIRDLGDGSCIFSHSNINEDNLLNYLFTIQQFILEIGMCDYTVITCSVIEYWGTSNKDLEVITDFPYSFFSVLYSDSVEPIRISIENKQLI